MMSSSPGEKLVGLIGNEVIFDEFYLLNLLFYDEGKHELNFN